MEREGQEFKDFGPPTIEGSLGEALRERAAEQARAQLAEAEKQARMERWHELLSTRYVCEACLTRYFMKYRKCKACGEIGRIRSLSVSLLDLADDNGELREMIANGQVFGMGPSGGQEPGRQ